MKAWHQFLRRYGGQQDNYRNKAGVRKQNMQAIKFLSIAEYGLEKAFPKTEHRSFEGEPLAIESGC
jgi:hypothetical protein